MAKSTVEKNANSVDLLWDKAFQEVDAWLENAKKREDLLLQSAKEFAENVKRNQNNLKELSEQFSKELREWEKTSREEILTTTTSLQYIFPFKSFEEINNQLDQVQSKAEEFTTNPFKNLVNGQYVDSFVNGLEQYVKFRQENRNQYVKHVKETASIIQENQRAFLAVMTNQMKSVFFPFNKYMERANELAK